MQQHPSDLSDQRTATVPDAAAGRRFDAVLAELFPQFSRSKLTTWIKSGEVLLNGVPMDRLGAEAFRSALGVVLQDDQLFTCSLYDNIAMNDVRATPERVEAAARLACIHDDIARMPMGYQTLVGGMGATLSGGQKQRLLLARALYKQPRFLLLDEYTSHLDFATEKRVQDAINALGCGRFIITHREHSLREGDAVRVLWQGKLIDPADVPAPEA